MRTRNSSAAEEEATKVMEVGNALGLDFRAVVCVGLMYGVVVLV